MRWLSCMCRLAAEGSLTTRLPASGRRQRVRPALAKVVSIKAGVMVRCGARLVVDHSSDWRQHAHPGGLMRDAAHQAENAAGEISGIARAVSSSRSSLRFRAASGPEDMRQSRTRARREENFNQRAAKMFATVRAQQLIRHRKAPSRPLAIHEHIVDIARLQGLAGVVRQFTPTAPFRHYRSQVAGGGAGRIN